ncbi:hypothetical protein GCM10028858_00370 [Halorubrum pallidum]
MYSRFSSWLSRATSPACSPACSRATSSGSPSWGSRSTQALRYIIPSWTNEFVYLIKYSSLAAFITVPELYYRAGQIVSETFRYTLIFVVTGVMYLALVLTASKAMERVDDRVAFPGLGADRET